MKSRLLSIDPANTNPSRLQASGKHGLGYSTQLLLLLLHRHSERARSHGKRRALPRQRRPCTNAGPIQIWRGAGHGLRSSINLSVGFFLFKDDK